MKKKKLIAILLNCCIVILLLVRCKETAAAVKINEIYPAPPTGEYEWVELYNDENAQINIKNFYLKDSSGKKIDLLTSEIISPYSFTIATSTAILNNSNQSGKDYADIISLYDSNNQSIDIATYSGTFNENKTFARCPDGNGNWFILTIITKNYSNETACLSLTPTATATPIPTLPPTPTPIATNDSQPSLTPTIVPSSTPTQTPTPSITPTPQPNSYDNIYLSEAMVYPETGEHEWVEIYNDNDYAVSLQNWYFDDVENAGSAPKLFSLEIPAKSFGSVDLTSSVFNNDSDQVRLLDFNKTLKDSFEYQTAEKGKTLGRSSFTNDEFCLQEPTKNSVNSPCFDLTNTPAPTSQNTPTPLKTPTPTKILTNTKEPFNNVETTRRVVFTNNILEQPGEILGTENQNQQLTNYDQNIINKKPIAYVKGFTTSSFFISLLNIFYIAHKIIRRLNNNETI